MNNTIAVIFPYRKNGVWMFDDAAKGLEQEPFVSGVPAMMDRLVAGIADAHLGFALHFSAGPFPGAQVKVDWVRAESGGNWYKLIVDGEEYSGWLCPAMYHYFAEAPMTIYAQAGVCRPD
jgi:uncharacterized protein DUF6717